MVHRSRDLGEDRGVAVEVARDKHTEPHGARLDSRCSQEGPSVHHWAVRISTLGRPLEMIRAPEMVKPVQVDGAPYRSLDIDGLTCIELDADADLSARHHLTDATSVSSALR